MAVVIDTACGVCGLHPEDAETTVVTVSRRRMPAQCTVAMRGVEGGDDTEIAYRPMTRQEHPPFEPTPRHTTDAGLPSDDDLRRALVAVGVVLSPQRYSGQHSTEAAHEFADAALEVVRLVEDRIVARLV